MIRKQGAKDGYGRCTFAVQKLQTKERERGYNGFIPRLKELWYGRPDSAGALSTLCATDPAFWRTRASCPQQTTAQ